MVRPATTDDLDAIAAVHVAGFQAGNAPHLPENRMTPERSAAGWRELVGSPAPTVVLVAEEEGAVAGVAGGGPARDDGEVGGELYALYVGPARWGRGHGTALDAAVREQLTEAGFGEAILWVLEGNTEAQAFYQRRGWRADGARRPHAGAVAVRYRVAL